MACFDVPGLLPFEQALKKLTDSVESITATEKVGLDTSLNRVLASPVLSPVNVPPYNNSAMDGYAFDASSLKKTNHLNVIGKSFAGKPFKGEVKPGQAVRIMTGAKLPKGSDTVVMQEQAVIKDNQLTLNAPPSPGANVRYKGEELKELDAALPCHHLIRPQELGLIATLGITEVEVFKKIKVALLASGDELIPGGIPLSDGEIYESNRIVIKNLLLKLGAEVIDLGIIPDDPDQLKQAFLQADEKADWVISTGGVSVGEADYTKDILAELGEIEFWKLAMKPGKPFTFGRLSNSYFSGLPGNPVSAFVTFHQLLVPALQKLQGRSSVRSMRVTAVASEKFNKKSGRLDFQRGLCTYNDAGDLEVKPAGNQSSAMLSSLTLANCYAVLEQDRADVNVGEKVQIIPFDGLINS